MIHHVLTSGEKGRKISEWPVNLHNCDNGRVLSISSHSCRLKESDFGLELSTLAFSSRRANLCSSFLSTYNVPVAEKSNGDTSNSMRFSEPIQTQQWSNSHQYCQYTVLPRYMSELFSQQTTCTQLPKVYVTLQ